MAIDIAKQYILTMQNGESAGSQKLPQLPYYMQVKVDTTGQQCICIYILSEIAAPFLYVPLLHILNTATENDNIFMYLSSPGGRLDTGIGIYDAMRRCKASLVTIGMDIVASSTALIFMGGKSLKTIDWSYVMYHNASYGAMGTNLDVKNQVDYTNMLVGDILKTAARLGLLTEEETAIIFNSDADIYIGHEELAKRVEQHSQSLLGAPSTGGANV
jgi:ATP-dependent protease ClpP protease subunit